MPRCWCKSTLSRASAAAVASTTTRPLFRMTMSSAISKASFAFCSTNRIDKPLLLQAPDRRHHLSDDLRRQALRRLVQEQHPRVRHQRPADRQHLLLAAGQDAGILPAPLRQQREGVEHPPTCRAKGKAGGGTRQGRGRARPSSGEAPAASTASVRSCPAATSPSPSNLPTRSRPKAPSLPMCLAEGLRRARTLPMMVNERARAAIL